VRRDRERRQRHQTQRVPVGRRARDLRHADRAAGAWLVVGDDALAPSLR
jgi:hypothetical protein